MVDKREHGSKAVKDVEVISEKEAEIKKDVATEQEVVVKDELDKEENLVEKYKDYKILDVNAFKKFLL